MRIKILNAYEVEKMFIIGSFIALNLILVNSANFTAQEFQSLFKMWVFEHFIFLFQLLILKINFSNDAKSTREEKTVALTELQKIYNGVEKGPFDGGCESLPPDLENANATCTKR